MMPGQGGQGGGMMPGQGGQMMPGQGGQLAGVGLAAGSVVRYKLIRFFDFTVEPGKTYKYRVRVVFVNPNFEVATRYLEASTLADEEFIASDWCEPTEAIRVPRPNHTLIGYVKPGKPHTEPEATLLVQMWHDEYAQELTSQRSAERGAWFGFKEEVAFRKHNDAKGAKESIDFNTDLMLIDMAGGDELAAGPDLQVARPSELLVMGPDGEMIIQSQSADSANYERETRRLKQIEDEVDKQKRDQRDRESKDGKSKGGRPGPGTVGRN
jgi:hypothetical protein